MPALTQKAKSDGGVQAVALALQIIESLAFAGRPQSITELAKELGTTKTRIFNYLRTLVEHGYAIQDPDTERYRIGSRAAQVGGAAANEFDLVSISRAPMARLRDDFGHTVSVSKFDGATLYCVSLLEGRSPLRISFPIGSVMGFHSTAQGKVALAFGPASLLDETIEKGLEKTTPFTVTSPARLREEVALARTRGGATAPSQAMMKVDSVAVPILNKSGQLMATIALVRFEDAMSEAMIKREVAALEAAAREIASALPFAF
jgi:IclR family transcriptional regulator, KDG regulon repressor